MQHSQIEQRYGGRGTDSRHSGDGVLSEPSARTVGHIQRIFRLKWDVGRLPFEDVSQRNYDFMHGPFIVRAIKVGGMGKELHRSLGLGDSSQYGIRSAIEHRVSPGFVYAAEDDKFADVRN